MGGRSMYDCRRSALVLALLIYAPTLAAQQQQPRQPASNRPRQTVVMDSGRARDLYVSNKAGDHPQSDFARQIAAKAATDSILAARSKGVMDFQKITYKSSADA